MRHGGFTFIEVMVSVVIMAIAATALVVLAAPADAGRASTAARLLASDLEHAQILALSRPEWRIAVTIDDDGAGWRIVDADAADATMIDTYDEFHAGRRLELRVGEGRASMISTARVTPAGARLIFTPLGGLESTAPLLRATVGEAVASVSVNTDTGFATILD